MELVAEPDDLEIDPVERLNYLFRLQKEAFLADPYPSAARRIELLKRIPVMLTKYRRKIMEALDADFQDHSHDQSDLLEILGMFERARFNIANVDKWMKPIKKASNPVTQGASKVYIKYHPKGVIGNMVTWNLPFDRGIGPLIDAFAAGDRVIIKPSEMAPNSGALLEEMIGETFEEDRAAVVNGDIDLARSFPKLPWDHLLFTGSGPVAKQVMRAAAENLVPVTLELGGKNPTIVGEDCVLDPLTIATIAGAKVMKRGQMCVAPDYCLVPEAKLEAFVSALVAYMNQHFAPNNAAPHACGIINDRHVGRLRELVADAAAHGAHVIQIGQETPPGNRDMPFYIVVDPDEDSEVMRYEIFGPILPIKTYKTVADAVELINRGETPLGVYIFSRDKAFIDEITTNTRSGGVAVNTIALQAGQPSMAFGGVGASGMGRLHGEEAFREFSNPRGYFERGTGGIIDWGLPPYGTNTRYLIDKVAYAKLTDQLKFALKILPKNIMAKFK